MKRLAFAILASALLFGCTNPQPTTIVTTQPTVPQQSYEVIQSPQGVQQAVVYDNGS